MAGTSAESDALCRACMAQLGAEKFDILQSPETAELYTRLSCSYVDASDFLPKSICTKCYDLLKDFDRFQTMCAESYKLLLVKFTKIIVPKVEEESDNVKVENMDPLETMECEEDDENFCDDEDIDATYDPLKDDGVDEEDEDEEEFKIDIVEPVVVVKEEVPVPVKGGQEEEVQVKATRSRRSTRQVVKESRGVEKGEEKADELDDDEEEEEEEEEEKKQKEPKAKGRPKPFACDKCPKTFYKKDRYDGHMRVHSGLKNIKAMEKHIVNVWSSDRKIKKTFFSFTTIDHLLNKAHSLGLDGSRIILESNGSEICEDEVLEYYVKEKSTLLLLEDSEGSTSENNFLNLSALINQSEENISMNADSFLQALQQNPKTELKHLSLASPDIASCVSDSSCQPDNLAMSSDALPSSSSTNFEGGKFFSKFVIPWHKMPNDILDLLNRKQKLYKRINAFANVIVDELRAIAYSVPMNIYRNIAQQAAEKYPDTFIEKDGDGNILSFVPTTLITCMRNRNNTLNRVPKRPATAVQVHIPTKERRKASIFQQTCLNWQPERIDSEAAEHKKNVMLSLYKTSSTLSTEELRTAKMYMKDTFAFQRLYINDNMPSVLDVKKHWPFIFGKDILYQHFEQLMQIDPKCCKANFLKETPKMNLFFKKRSSRAETDIGIIQSITDYFHEDNDLLFKLYKFGTTMTEIEADIPTKAPWLALCDASKDSVDRKVAHIFIERSSIYTSENESLIDLITSIVCFYYVFNIIYPKNINQTMEFITRFFFKNYSTIIRGEKTNLNNISKILNLMKKITSI